MNDWDFDDIIKGENWSDKKVNLETKLEEDIIAECPACKKQSYFRFIGIQEIKDKSTKLYNCLYCHTTRAEQSLWRYNGNSLMYISNSVYKIIESYIKGNRETIKTKIKEDE